MVGGEFEQQRATGEYKKKKRRGVEGQRGKGVKSKQQIFTVNSPVSVLLDLT